MTTPKPTQTELETNAARLRKEAKAVEERWRTAHGFDIKLRGKRRREAQPKRLPLERGEVRRREEHKRERIERKVLRVPLLKGVGPSSDAGSRLIKRAEVQQGSAPQEGAGRFAPSRGDRGRHR
jgi:hypothetical protein